jgi:hypothetical protein
VTDLVPIAGKLAKLIRLLGSNRPGEVAATVEALNRTLQTVGADIHDVADRIEHSSNGALSEHEMKEIYDAGIKEGIRRIEHKLRNQASHGAPQSLAIQFPAARDMAMYCYQRIDQLNEWESEFITNMASWTRIKPLSLKQQAHLEKIYIKLRGRI